MQTTPLPAELSATARERAYKRAMMLSEIASIKIVGDATSVPVKCDGFCWNRQKKSRPEAASQFKPDDRGSGEAERCLNGAARADGLVIT